MIPITRALAQHPDLCDNNRLSLLVLAWSIVRENRSVQLLSWLALLGAGCFGRILCKSNKLPLLLSRWHPSFDSVLRMLYVLSMFAINARMGMHSPMRHIGIRYAWRTIGTSVASVVEVKFG